MNGRIVLIVKIILLTGLINLSAQTTWTKHNGNPILGLGPSGSWDDVWIASPRVLITQSSYEMFYSAFDGNNIRIGYAISQDGLAWTKYKGNPVINEGSDGTWDDKFLFVGSVILDDSTYNLWYGGFDGGIWRIGYATSNVDPVSVQTSGTLIETFSLSQNFPNPFNPSTTIKYRLKERANVELKIFDIIGRDLSILIDE